MRHLLQRLRFRTAEPVFVPPDTMFGKFDPAEWVRKCEAAYWRRESGGRLIGDTFFNAFFAAYWRRLTSIETLGLRLRVSGRCRAEVLRHGGSGEAEVVASRELEAGEADLPLDFGGRSWGLRLSVALTALEDGADLLGGGWYTDDAPLSPVRLTVAITTHNRKEAVVPLCRQLLDDPELEAAGVRVHVVDQSDADALGFLAGPRCRVTRQRNLGGAGGFARAMREALRDSGPERPTHLLLMDDDVMLEADSVLRAVRMTERAREPFVLGGVMLDAHRPGTARNLGHTFRRNDAKFFSTGEHLHQFEVADAQAPDAFSVPHRSDYCAWWFCLLPVAAIPKTGLPAAFFYQADDVEYGARAGACGYPSWLVPGIGVWHVPFHTKAAAWSRYFRYYNTLLVNALQGPEDFAAAFNHTGIKALWHLFQAEYRDAAAILRALEDISGGWARFEQRRFPAYLAELRAELERYPAEKTINLKLIQDVQMRIRNAALRFQDAAVAMAVQQELAARLPETYTPEYWDRLFAGE